jgi:hypothetical protein
MLAHINPEEAEMLQQMGGSGTTNPNTGLPEYFFGGLGGIVPSLFGGGNSTAGLGSLFGLLPSMTKSSPKSSRRGFLGGILANPDIMKKVIESGALGVVPNQLKPGLFKKLEDNGTMPKPQPQNQNPKPDMPNIKEMAQKLIRKRGNSSSDDDSSMFGGMFGALPAIAKSSLGGIGSMATGALSPMPNEMMGNEIIGGLAPSLKSNIGNIIRKMNPEDLQKGYAMSGRWGE